MKVPANSGRPPLKRICRKLRAPSSGGASTVKPSVMVGVIKRHRKTRSGVLGRGFRLRHRAASCFRDNFCGLFRIRVKIDAQFTSAIYCVVNDDTGCRNFSAKGFSKLRRNIRDPSRGGVGTVTLSRALRFFLGDFLPPSARTDSFHESLLSRGSEILVGH
jgi:hypothetical protein